MDQACRIFMYIIVHALITQTESGHGDSFMERLLFVGHNALFDQIRKSDGEHLSMHAQVMLALKAGNDRFRYLPDTHLDGVSVHYEFQAMLSDLLFALTG